MNNTTITIKTDKVIKKKSKQLFADLGLDMSTAINMFLRQCIRENGIPFISSRVPNALTLKAIRDAQNGVNVNGSFDTIDEVMESINNADD